MRYGPRWRWAFTVVAAVVVASSIACNAIPGKKVAAEGTKEAGGAAAFPAGVGKMYEELSKVIRARNLPAFMPIFHRAFIFEAADGSALDRGPWRRLWMERFEETRYEKLSFELDRVLKQGDAELSLRVRRVLAWRETEGAELQLLDSTFDDTWVKAAEGWQIIVRKESGVRAQGVIPPAWGARIESPRIAALAKELAAGKPESLAAFWKGIETGGGPLVEAVEGKDNLALVTTLWRARGGELRVRLEGGKPGRQGFKSLRRLAETDLWYRSERLSKKARFTYRLHVQREVASPAFAGQPKETLTVASIELDSLNPKQVDGASLVELSAAEAFPRLAAVKDRDSGALERMTVRSSILDERRFVSVYTPPGYDDSDKAAPSSAVFLLDRGDYASRRLTRTGLDNLGAERAVRPAVVFMLHSEGSKSAGLETTDRFVRFVGEELVAWARENFKLSKDPADYIIGGNGVGGSIAAFCAAEHPETFGSVLCESADFSRCISNADGGGSRCVPGRFAKPSDTKPRFYLSLGDLESNALVASNRHLRDVLRAGGYKLKWSRFPGNHNSRTWCAALAVGLEALLPGS
ncbi:MAG: alpha/beta hydrolase-fold protein [Planctomycetes bacterium]|nr:alpha/beta hydrolase-fold protein [Planctomycetota bacterium]